MKKSTSQSSGAHNFKNYLNENLLLPQSSGRLWVYSGITIFKLKDVSIFSKQKSASPLTRAGHHPATLQTGLWDCFPSRSFCICGIAEKRISWGLCFSGIAFTSLIFQIFNILKKNTSIWAKPAGPVDSSHCCSGILVGLKTHCCHQPIEHNPVLVNWASLHWGYLWRIQPIGTCWGWKLQMGCSASEKASRPHSQQPPGSCWVRKAKLSDLHQPESILSRGRYLCLILTCPNQLALATSFYEVYSSPFNLPGPCKVPTPSVCTAATRTTFIILIFCCFGICE